MNPSFRAGLLAGIILGSGVTALAFILVKGRPEAPVVAGAPGTPKPAAESPADPKPAPAPAVEKEAAKAPPPLPEAKTEAAATKPSVKDLFPKLTELGLSAFASPKFGEAVDAVKAGGKAALDFLANVLRTSSSATERFLSAALLEKAGDPSAIGALAETLKSDPDLLVRRQASHAIALLGTNDAAPPLRAAMTEDADWGVRVNSAYGVAKLGNEDGLRILREAYESTSTPSEYRLAILGGLADVAAPSTAPLFRQILADTKDVSYLLMSMHALATMKDVQSIPALEQIANSSQADMVKQAAAKTIEAIRK